MGTIVYFTYLVPFQGVAPAQRSHQLEKITRLKHQALLLSADWSPQWSSLLYVIKE